jgi:multidrug efflux pump subunit AcrA (membrane-fusion protein)
MILFEKEFTQRRKGAKDAEINKGLRKRFFPCLILLITVILLPGCERLQDAKERIKEVYGKVKKVDMSAEQQIPVYAVNTSTAVRGQIQDYLALSGKIVAGSTVDVYSEAAGKVSAVYVSIGQRVSRGSRIAAVDPSRPGMNFREYIATAPIAGTVVALPAQRGMTISQAVPLARISGGGGLEIQLYVAERFISKMAMNLPCEITLDAWPGETFQGSISEISPTVDLASRTMEVKVNVHNPGSKLKAGMFAKVRIITEQKSNIVKIPVTAMVNRFGETYVFTVDRISDPEYPLARKKIITPGIQIDGIQEVSRGLAANEEIVVRGMSLLEDGSRLNVIERVAPLSAR